jgi:hypothetical protein
MPARTPLIPPKRRLIRTRAAKASSVRSKKNGPHTRRRNPPCSCLRPIQSDARRRNSRSRYSQCLQNRARRREHAQTEHARTIRLTQQPKENIIPSTRSGAPQGGRHQIGTPAGFGSEQVAGFRLECMAGFVGIRTTAVKCGVIRWSCSSLVPLQK